MTEERFIVTKSFLKIWITDFDDDVLKLAEPAPPKDWKPKCWGNLPYCGIPLKPVPMAVVFESCQKCPYRKME